MSAASDIVAHPNAEQVQSRARLIILNINASIGCNLHIRSTDAFDGTVRTFVIDVLRQCAVSPVSKEFFRLIKRLDGRRFRVRIDRSASIAARPVCA
jgi:hypothetical protein